MYKLLQKTLGSTNAEKLTASDIPCGRVIIQAKRGNSGAILVGDSTVASGKGHELNIPQANVYIFPLILESKGQNDLNLQNIYVLGTQNDVVNVFYYEF